MNSSSHDLSILVKATTKFGPGAREYYLDIWRGTFQAYRISRPGICFTHMDEEPCAECWVR